MIDPDARRMGLEVGAIGFCGALLGGLLSGAYQHIRDLRRRPVLEFEFEDCSAKQKDSPYLRQASWKEGEHQHDWVVVRASVRNNGKSTAKYCRIYLIGLHEMQDGNKKSAGFFDSLSLPWAGWDFQPRDLPPKVNSFIDLVRFRKDVPAWNFTFQVFSGDRAALDNFEGTYRFKIIATADNADPAYLEVSVDYRKNWQNVRAWKASRSFRKSLLDRKVLSAN